MVPQWSQMAVNLALLAFAFALNMRSWTMAFAQSVNGYRIPAGGRRISGRENPVEANAPCCQIVGAMNRIMAEHFGVAGKGCFDVKPARSRSARTQSVRRRGNSMKKGAVS